MNRRKATKIIRRALYTGKYRPHVLARATSRFSPKYKLNLESRRDLTYITAGFVACTLRKGEPLQLAQLMFCRMMKLPYAIEVTWKMKNEELAA